MAMFKKNFKLLAWEMSQVEPSRDTQENINDHYIWAQCVNAIANACRESNSMFDRSKFYNACHAEYWKTHVIPH